MRHGQGTKTGIGKKEKAEPSFYSAAKHSESYHWMYDGLTVCKQTEKFRTFSTWYLFMNLV